MLLRKLILYFLIDLLVLWKFHRGHHINWGEVEIIYSEFRSKLSGNLKCSVLAKGIKQEIFLKKK